MSLNIFHDSKGQTLIETIVAIFVLVTGLSAGVTLAIFAFGENNLIRDRLIATGLAREGLEVVRGMRDSNWINEASNSANLRNCSFYGSGELCYQDWLNSVYDIRGRNGSGLDHRVVFNPLSATSNWSVENEPLGGPSNSFYRLYEMQGAGYSHLGGTPSNFYRKITLVYDSANNNHRRQEKVLVRSAVWWHGKRCDNSITELNDSDDTTCQVVIEEYLTNWRNY